MGRRVDWLAVGTARRFVFFCAWLTFACGGGGSTDLDAGNAVVPGLDIAVTFVDLPATVVAGESISVTHTVANVGDVTATEIGVFFLLAHEDTPLAFGASLHSRAIFSLDPSEESSRTTTVQIPDNVAGARYVLAVYALMDALEANTDNNIMGSPVTVAGDACTDDAFENDDDWGSAKTIAVGETQTRNNCFDLVDWLRLELVARQTLALDGGRVYTLFDVDGTTELAGPDLYPFVWVAPRDGTYYVRMHPLLGRLLLGVGSDYDVRRGDERPDLVVGSVFWRTPFYPGGIRPLSGRIDNQGFGPAGASSVTVYLSSDADVTTADMALGTMTFGALAAGANQSLEQLEYLIPSSVTPGPYYLAAIVDPASQVNESQENNNTSSPQMIDVVVPGCAPDAYEDDELPATATPIQIGVAQLHNFCEDQRDWMSFSAEAGVQYTITIDGGTTTVLNELYDTDATTLLLADSQSSYTQWFWTAPATGTYHVRVELWLQPFGVGDDYQVLVERALPDLIVRSNVSVGFDGVPGGLAEVRWTMDNTGYVASVATQLGVYLSTDDIITNADRRMATIVVPPVPASGSQASPLDPDLARIPVDVVPGAYFVGLLADDGNVQPELDENNNASTPGAITVVALLCSMDGFEQDDFVTEASVITTGSVQSRNQCDDGWDWVQLSVVSDAPYVIVVDDLGNIFVDRRIRVFASDGQSLLAGPDTSLSDGQLFFRPNQSGTHYLLIGDSPTDSDSGDYQLLVDLCDEDLFEENDALADAATIAVGATQTHNFCDDRADWLRFDAIATTTYTIETTGIGTNVDTILYLTDANGTTLASNNDVNGPADSRIIWTAPATGGYYLRVEPNSSFSQSSWGFDSDYQLSLQ